MGTEIWLARHGETDWNKNNKWQGQTNVALNENGIMQAEKLADSLGRVRIDKIYSSDLDRAYKTAKIVADHLGIKSISTDSRLRERNLGKVEGLTTSEIESLTGVKVFSISWNKIAEEYEIEPWNSLLMRVWSAIEDVRNLNPGSRILIVSHGGVMRAIAQKVRNQEGFPFNFSNGELLKIFSDGNGWSVD